MKETSKNNTAQKPPLRGGLVGLYGLPYCDATAGVTKWLQANDYSINLHNYKTDGIDEVKLKEWCSKLGWQKVLNKRSTTWRSLSQQKQDAVTDEAAAISIMLQYTSLIKRPVIEFGNNLLLGFDEKALNTVFK